MRMNFKNTLLAKFYEFFHMEKYSWNTEIKYKADWWATRLDIFRRQLLREVIDVNYSDERVLCSTPQSCLANVYT